MFRFRFRKEDLRPRSGPASRFADASLFDRAARTSVVVVYVATVDTADGGRDCRIATPATADAAVFASPPGGPRQGHLLDGGCGRGHVRRGHTDDDAADATAAATVASGGRTAEGLSVVHSHDGISRRGRNRVGIHDRTFRWDVQKCGTRRRSCV